MSDDHDGRECEWVNVSFGTGLPDYHQVTILTSSSLTLAVLRQTKSLLVMPHQHIRRHMLTGQMLTGQLLIGQMLTPLSNNNDRLTAFDPGQPG